VSAELKDISFIYLFYLSSFQVSKPHKIPSHQGGPRQKSPVADNRQQAVSKGKLRVTVERAPKSHVTALLGARMNVIETRRTILTKRHLDFCDGIGLSQPQFHHEIVTDSEGKNAHKVWVVLDLERLELPVTFPSLSVGRERVAKQVLRRLRSRANKNNS
jgi:hypothetical protein